MLRRAPRSTLSPAPTLCRSQAADKNPVVVMETSMGTVKIELYPEKAPVTVKNFLAYVDDKFYDRTVFHRVIPHFIDRTRRRPPDITEMSPLAAVSRADTHPP